jgi:hypothetical protein
MVYQLLPYIVELTQGALLIVVSCVVLTPSRRRLAHCAPLLALSGAANLALSTTALFNVHNHSLASAWVVVLPMVLALTVASQVGSQRHRDVWLLYGVTLSLLLTLLAPRWMTDVLRSPLQDALLILGAMPFIVRMWQDAESKREVFGRRPTAPVLVIGVICIYVIDALQWHIAVVFGPNWSEAYGIVRGAMTLVSMLLALTLFGLVWTRPQA